MIQVVEEKVVIHGVCERCDESFSYKRKKGSAGRKRRFCRRCVKAPPKGVEELNIHKTGHIIHVRLRPEEASMLDLIQERLGSSQVEGVRTAIRVYHALLLRE